MKIELIRDMAAEFSPAALGEIAENAKARAELIRQYTPDLGDPDFLPNMEAYDAFTALAAACEKIVALGAAVVVTI